jgi:hypothetical protein
MNHPSLKGRTLCTLCFQLLVSSLRWRMLPTALLSFACDQLSCWRIIYEWTHLSLLWHEQQRTVKTHNVRWSVCLVCWMNVWVANRILVPSPPSNDAVAACAALQRAGWTLLTSWMRSLCLDA